MNFRLTQLLAKKSKAGVLSSIPLAEDPLTDWSARVFNVSRTQYVIITNTASLYSAVIYARGLNNAHELIVGLMGAIADTMKQDGFAAAYDQRIANHSGPNRFATPLNRSVTGSMTDMVDRAKWMLANDLSPDQVASRLNDTPMFAISGPDGRPGAFPIKAIKALIDNTARAREQ